MQGWHYGDYDLFYGADKDEAAFSVYYGAFGEPGVYAAFMYNYGKLENTFKTMVLKQFFLTQHLVETG
ncbi:MAG: hypothetical protein ACI4VX_01300 [Succinivibrionaceae bacterium]